MGLPMIKGTTTKETTHRKDGTTICKEVVVVAARGPGTSFKMRQHKFWTTPVLDLIPQLDAQHISQQAVPAWGREDRDGSTFVIQLIKQVYSARENTRLWSTSKSSRRKSQQVQMLGIIYVQSEL